MSILEPNYLNIQPALDRVSWITLFEALLAVPVESARMDVDKKTSAQILVSIAAIGLFIAGLVVLAAQYGTESNGAIEMTPTGGLVLVGFIAVFIVAMPVFGYLVEQADLDSE